MEDIRFLKYLIADIESELRYIKTYQEAEALARKNESWVTYCSMRIPSKQKIKDDLKMVRRITLEMERKIKDE